MDCFYRPLTDEERVDCSNYNFDHPNAFDWELLLDVLKELKQGKAVKCPQYDFTTHSRKKEFTLMYGADVVLCEGILILHDPKILEQFDVKVFVKTDDDIRLIRRIKRDMANRGRTLDGILAQYQQTVKPSYHTFCAPTQSAADVVIPRGRDNVVAIQLLCDHIKNKLIEGGNVNPIFYKSSAPSSMTHQSSSPDIPSNVLVPDQDDQVLKAVEELHEEVDGKRLLQTIMVLCNKLLTLCLKEFMPRRFFTPSASPRPDPTNFNMELKAEEEAEVIMFVDEQDEDGEAIVNTLGSCTDSEECDSLTVGNLCEELHVGQGSSGSSSSDADVIGSGAIGSGAISDDISGDKQERKRRKLDHPPQGMNGARQSLDGTIPILPLDEGHQGQKSTCNGINRAMFMDEDIDTHEMPLAECLKQHVCVVTIFSGGMLFGETIMERIGNNKSFKVDWGSIHIFHESKKPAKPRFYDRQLPLNIIDQKVIMVCCIIIFMNDLLICTFHYVLETERTMTLH